MRKAAWILLALLAIRLLPGTLRRQARALELIGLLMQMTAMAAANTSKTVSVENRTGDLETRVGNLEQGIFPNVSGGSTITLDTQQGSVTLHCGALSSFSSGPQAQFLAALQKLNHLSGQPFDNNTGSSWATGERGYTNNLVQWVNDIDGDLQNKGWMN